MRPSAGRACGHDDASGEGHRVSNVILFGLGAKTTPPSLKAYGFSEVDMERGHREGAVAACLCRRQ